MSTQTDQNVQVDTNHINCVECGGSYRPEEIFVAVAHKREYACRGCVAQYLSNGSWPHSD